MTEVFRVLIKIYQVFSRMIFPPCCRYYPSCSEYASEAMRKYGLLKSLKLILWRLIRCTPFFRGGFDPLN